MIAKLGYLSQSFRIPKKNNNHRNEDDEFCKYNPHYFAYFAMCNQIEILWQTDESIFNGMPEFILASNFH